MLDLVVKSAVPKIGDQTALNVSSGQNLLVQEIHLIFFLQYRHALVVGREYRAHIDSTQCPVNSDEGSAVPRTQEEEDNRQIGSQSSNNQHWLSDGIAHSLFAYLVGYATKQQAKGGEHQKRIEQKGLIPHCQATDAPHGAGLLLGEGE